MTRPIRIIITAVALLLLTNGVQAQTLPIPADVQLSVFSRVMSYERHFYEKIGDEKLIIGLLFQSNYALSEQTANEIWMAMNNMENFGGFEVQVVAIDLSESQAFAENGLPGLTSTDMSGLTEKLTNNGIHVMYVAPLKNVDLDKIANISRATQVLTMTGVPHYVRTDLSVGIYKKEGRPIPAFNMKSVQAEGARFNSIILSIAKTIND